MQLASGAATPIGPTTRRQAETTDDARRTCLASVVADPFFDWADDRPPRHRPERHRHLRGARQGGHHAPSRDRAESCAGPTAASPTRRSSTTCSSLGVTADRAACPSTSSSTTPAWSSPACATTGATTRSASSRRTTSTRRAPGVGQQVQEFKSMVRTLHEAGIEVILDVVYNHTAEGNHLGPTLAFKGHRQRGVLPARRRRPAALHGLHGHRQHAQHAPPARAAADHGQPALLGHRDARRRLPLRPGLRAGPRAARGRPAVGLLRPHPAGPGHQPGQADRRAVGRRRGRLPGRQLPAAVVRVERQVPRLPPRLLAGRGADARRVRLPAHRLVGPLRVERAHSRTPASTSSPRTTASRCGTWSRTTTSTTTPTARATPTASNHNRSWNCGVEGPTDDAASARAAGAPDAQLPRHAAAVAGHADGAGRRRAGPHAGRQQQRLLPGQRDVLVRLGAADDASCSSSCSG